MKKEQWCFL